MLFPLTWPLMWPTSLLTSAVGSPKSSETFASNSSVPHGKGLRSTDVHGSRRQTRRTDLWAIHVWKQPNQAFTDGNKLLTVRGQANCNGLQPTSDGLQPKREREREVLVHLWVRILGLGGLQGWLINRKPAPMTPLHVRRRCLSRPHVLLLLLLLLLYDHYYYYYYYCNKEKQLCCEGFQFLFRNALASLMSKTNHQAAAQTWGPKLVLF